MEKFAPRLNGALLLLSDQLEWSIDSSVNGYWRTWGENGPWVFGFLNAYVKKLNAWRELTPIFEALGSVGIDPAKWESRDDAASYTRIFSFKKLFGEETDLPVHGTLVGDTNECRRVLTGYTAEKEEATVKTGGDPIYKLECNEEAGGFQPPSSTDDI